MSSAGVALAAVKLAIKANAIGIESAAELVEGRRDSWKSRLTNDYQDKLLAGIMVAELTMIVAGIRLLAKEKSS